MLETFVIFLPGCEVVLKATHYLTQADAKPPAYDFYDQNLEESYTGAAVRVASFPIKTCYGIINEEYAVQSRPSTDDEFKTNDEDEDDDKEF